MDTTNCLLLESFTTETLPTLDVAVLGALELFSNGSLPSLEIERFGKRPLVIGSGNALVVGRILFKDLHADFADESNYKDVASAITDFDSIVIISASGGKHSIEIAQYAKEKNIPTWLLTNTENSPAGEHIEKERTILFPKNREPYTYNTSTYLSMLLAQSKESPEEIHTSITEKVSHMLPDNLGTYDSVYMIIPEQFNLIQGMFMSKFDELFGARVSGRVFTFSQSEHAKTVVPSEKELFIHLGEEHDEFGLPEHRFHIPLESDAGYGAVLSIGYYVIGRIQSAHPPYFKEHIVEYAKQASALFSQDIKPIVE